MSKDPKDRIRKTTHSYLRYSGLAFQMAGTIFLGWWLGSLIDKRLENESPIAAVILLLLFMVGIFYKIYRDVTSEDF